MPKDFTLAIPNNAASWLLKAGIGFDLAKHYGFGYSEKYDRVILPVYNDGELVAFTSRAVGATRPKYIARYKEGLYDIIFSSDPGIALPSSDELRDRLPDLVVVEDVLSAVRVGRVAPTSALLGTTAAGKELALLRASGRESPTVGVWMDGDTGGRKGREQVARDLSLVGAKVIKINTPLDPKKYSNRQIREILLDRCSPTTVDAES